MANRDLARFQNVRHKVHTNSSLSDLGICEKLWWWKHVEHKEQVRSGFARSLFRGIGVHDLIDLQVTEPDGDHVEHVKHAVMAAINPFENLEGVEVEKETADLTAVMRAYLAWGETAAPMSKWASNVVSEIPWLERWTNGSRIILAGVLDGIGIGLTERPVIYEHKTTSERDLYAYLGKLKADPQIMIYAWAALQKYGVLPEGIVYTVVRSYPPKELRFKKDGELRAGDVVTDRATFERCFKEQERSLDSMNEHEQTQYEMACKRPWAIREFWPIRLEDLERWRLENDAKIRRSSIIRRSPHLAITNRAACRNLWGRECQYIPLCEGTWVADGMYSIRTPAMEVERALNEKPLLRKTTTDGKRKD